LATDGLWDIVTTGDRALKLIKETKEPLEAAKKLCATAVKSRKCHDNVTVMVVNLRPEKKDKKSSSPRKTTGKDKDTKEDKEPGKERELRRVKSHKKSPSTSSAHNIEGK